ncbi:DUF4342 domain-containing protein [Clostridium butyricum]
MEKNEMVEILISKVNVSREEAQEALEKYDWDLLQAIIYLENQGKVENNEENKLVKVKVESQEESKNEKTEEKHVGIGELVGRIFKFIGKVIKKGNENYFEIRKENEKTIKIPITVSILLLIFLSVPTVALLIIGLFCGYKYSISSPNFKSEAVNEVFEKVSKSADNIKKDFKEGYSK